MKNPAYLLSSVDSVSILGLGQVSPQIKNSCFSAFASLAAGRPQAWDGAENWPANGPFSPLLMGTPKETVQKAIERASSWEELADIGAQWLNPWAQKNRGMSDVCARAAWETWSKSEWTLAAAPDAFLTQKDKLIGEKKSICAQDDIAIDPAAMGEFQWTAAKGLLSALCGAREFGELAEAVAHFFAIREVEWEAWAARHNPGLIDEKLAGGKPRLVIGRADGELVEHAGASRSMHAMAEKVLGSSLRNAVGYPLNEPKPMTEKEARTWRAEQAYAWRGESLESFWIGRSNPESLTRDEEAQRLVDKHLPLDKQSLSALGRLLADHFGLRSVEINPVGGSARAKREITRAFAAFSSLAKDAALDSKSLGLGGLAVQVGAANWVETQNWGAYYRPHSARGPISESQPGLMAFGVPFGASSLAHEWTHAWDYDLLKGAKERMSEEAVSVLEKAKEELQKTVLFEEPVTPQTRKAYLSREAHELKRDLIAETLDKQRLTEAFLARGTPEAKARAEKGALPENWEREIREVWAVIENGSEKAIRAALAFAAKKNFESVGQNNLSPEDWARVTAPWIVGKRKNFQEMRAMAFERKQWGPMRWEAALRDKKDNRGYWAKPEELLARAAQTFFESLDPTHYLRDACPWGEEASRSNAAFERFFKEARPVFDNLAEKRDEAGLVIETRPVKNNFIHADNAVLSAAKEAFALNGALDLSRRRSAFGSTEKGVATTHAEPLKTAQKNTR